MSTSPALTLVLLKSVYDNDTTMTGVAIESALLSDEHVKVLDGSVPSMRRAIPGCDSVNGDFCTPDPELPTADAGGNLDLEWTRVDDVLTYTTQHHCRVIVAYYDE